MHVLNKGLKSDLFDIGDGRVLKLYNGWVSKELVEYEFKATNTAFDAGIPCAYAYDFVEKDYRYGIVFQLIKGKDALQQLLSRPWGLKESGIQMARLHARVHALQTTGLNAQSTRIDSYIEASYSLLKPYWGKITERRAALSSDAEMCLCHGDFSVENILVEPNGKMALLDWFDACIGQPAADVARAWLLLNSPYRRDILPLWASALGNFARGQLFRYYLQEYAAITGIDAAECLAWRLPVAAARLHEAIPKEKEWLLSLIKNM